MERSEEKFERNERREEFGASTMRDSTYGTPGSGKGTGSVPLFDEEQLRRLSLSSRLRGPMQEDRIEEPSRLFRDLRS